jgi:hypothetical protein
MHGAEDFSLSLEMTDFLFENLDMLKVFAEIEGYIPVFIYHKIGYLFAISCNF